MAYIGNKPTVGNFQICDAISVVNGQAAYTMQVGSVNVIPQSSNHMIVSLNGTIQKPGGTNPSFTVSGSTITFASNLATGDVIDFIQILGDVLDLGVPSDATVTAAKLNNDIISGTTALTSEPADTDEFIVSDACTIKIIDYSLIKGGLAHLSTTDFSGSSSNVEISLDYSAHENFLLVCSLIQGSSSSGGENCDVHFKRDGESSFDTGGSDYGFAGTFHDTDTAHNVNTADAMEVYRGRAPNVDNMFVAQITGVGNATTKSSFKVQYTQSDNSGGGTSAQTNHGTNFSNERIVAMRFSFTAGTVTKIKAKLYGYGE